MDSKQFTRDFSSLNDEQTKENQTHNRKHQYITEDLNFYRNDQVYQSCKFRAWQMKHKFILMCVSCRDTYPHLYMTKIDNDWYCEDCRIAHKLTKYQQSVLPHSSSFIRM